MLTMNVNKDNNSNGDTKSTLASPESVAVVCNGINNGALVSLAYGDYNQARSILVSGLGLLHTHRQHQQTHQPNQQHNYKITTTGTSSPCETTSHVHAAGAKNGLPTTASTGTKSDVIVVNNSVSNKIYSLPKPTWDPKQNIEQLQQFPFYTSYLYIPCMDDTSSVHEIFVTILFNVCMIYLKEAIEGRTSLFPKALYAYNRLLGYILATTNIANEATSNGSRVHTSLHMQSFLSPLCFVGLATCYNMACIYKELGQPKLYRTLMEISAVFEYKIQNHMPMTDRNFFGVHRMFAKSYEQSCAKAA
jgi:hypothetical protein